MYIGEVSKLTGLSIKAIRFYEEKGLLPPPLRAGRYRVYRDCHINILILIKEAKALGMTLTQLRAAARFQDGELDWQQVVRIMLDIRHKLVEQIDDLQRKVARLDECYAQLSPAQLSPANPTSGHSSSKPATPIPRLAAM